MKKNKYTEFKTILFFIACALSLACVGPPEVPPSTPADVAVGVDFIQEVPNWDNTQCGFEAGHEWFNPFGEQVRLAALVEEDYGFNFQELNWWIEVFIFNGYNCVDDDTFSEFDGGLPGNDCVNFSTETAGSSATNVTFQVVGECDNCINFSTSGTWFKGSMTIDPNFLGNFCNTNTLSLVLQPRVECSDPTKMWGCGPGEFQD